MLSETEERHLFERLNRSNDRSAAWKLAYSHLRIPLKVAKDYQGYDIPVEDLIQEGNIGLLKAIKAFNPLKNVRFSVLAKFWVKSEINAYIIKNWRLVKTITNDKLKKLFYSFQREKTKMEHLGYRNDSLYRALAEKLKVSQEDLHDFEQRTSHEVSLDDPNEYLLLPHPALEDFNKEYPCLESDLLRINLSNLPERTKFIIESRYLSNPNLTLKEVSEKLKISQARVHQIEVNALKSLKKELSKSHQIN